MSTLHVAVVSWNLGGAEVDFGSVRRVADRLDVERMDVVCVVAQELHSLSLREIGGGDAPEQAHRVKWDDSWAEVLGGFVRVAAVSVGAIRTSVFCSRSVAAEARDVEVDSVACGLGGVLTNKGAAAVRLGVRKTSICFVGAHLAAHAKHVLRRNQNFHRINAGLLPSF